MYVWMHPTGEKSLIAIRRQSVCYCTLSRYLYLISLVLSLVLFYSADTVLLYLKLHLFPIFDLLIYLDNIIRRLIHLPLRSTLPHGNHGRSPTIQAPHFAVIEQVRLPMATASATSALLTTVSSNLAGALYVSSKSSTTATAPSSYMLRRLSASMVK